MVACVLAALNKLLIARLLQTTRAKARYVKRSGELHLRIAHEPVSARERAHGAWCVRARHREIGLEARGRRAGTGMYAHPHWRLHERAQLHAWNAVTACRKTSVHISLVPPKHDWSAPPRARDHPNMRARVRSFPTECSHVDVRRTEGHSALLVDDRSRAIKRQRASRLREALTRRHGTLRRVRLELMAKASRVRQRACSRVCARQALLVYCDTTRSLGSARVLTRA